MRKLESILDKIAGICEKIGIAVTAVCAMVALLCLLYQVVTRALLPQFSVLWTAEIARICLIVATFNGGAVGLRRGDLIAMTFIADRIPGRARKVYDIILHGAAFFFLCVFVKYAFVCIPVYQKIKSLTLPMNLAWVICLVALGGVLMLVIEVTLLYKAVVNAAAPKQGQVEGGAQT